MRDADAKTALSGAAQAHSTPDRRNALRPSARSTLIDILQQRQDSGRPVRFWLRDDDAVEPGTALDQLLGLTHSYSVPMTLAVIPAFSGEALAQRLQPLSRVDVAVHGWAHLNHAPATEKKQELGAHRALVDISLELQRGLRHLQHWHGQQCVPLLVPPWNRIAASLVPLLQPAGFQALSTFADIRFESCPMINTQVDIIDWKGGRSGRPTDVLFDEISAQLQAGRDLTGILTHHLVHDQQAWHFLEQLFELTASHSAVEWLAIRQILSAERPDPGLPGQ